MLKPKFRFTYKYVNPETGCCDDLKQESVIVFNDKTLSQLIKHAKFIISELNDVYAIKIETLETNKIHIVV